nr:AraC family transcriptional regulator [Pseudomaricurvus alkylphenolicus]
MQVENVAHPLISSSFLEGLSDFVLERGGDPEDYARRVGLSRAALHADNLLVPYLEHTHLLELVAREYDTPWLGLEMARRQSVAVFGPLFALMTRSETVEEGFYLLARHLNICVQNLDIQIHLNDDLAVFSAMARNSAIDNSTTFQDHAMGLAWQNMQILYGDKCNLRAVYFRHEAPADTSVYTRFFRCPVAFNHPNLELVADARYVLAPIAESARQIPHLLRQHLQEKHQGKLTEQVKQIISHHLIMGDCSIHTVATAMGFSTRTLQRHLQEQQATFQQLVEEVRRQQALEYLSSHYYRLTDIAALLGYSELSAFTRSFKRWFGISPQRWRQEWVPSRAS